MAPKKQISEKMLETSICTKNGIGYIKGNEYIMDCLAPTKIYRFVFHIKEKKKTESMMNDIKKLIDEDKKELIKLVKEIGKIMDKENEVKKVNEYRDRVRELDYHLIIHNISLKNLEKKTNIFEIDEKPFKMQVLPRKIKETVQDEVLDELEQETQVKEQEKEKIIIQDGGKNVIDNLDKLDLIYQDIDKPKKPRYISRLDDYDIEYQEMYEDKRFSDDLELSTSYNDNIYVPNTNIVQEPDRYY